MTTHAPQKNSRKNYPLALLPPALSGVTLGVADILFKQALRATFTANPEPVRLTSWLDFHLERNSALAFSISMPFQLILAINVVVFAFIFWFLARQLDFSKKLAVLTFSLMVAGAVSNLWERLTLGFVTDFISVGSFPVFNLADSFITISVFLLVLFYDKMNRNH